MKIILDVDDVVATNLLKKGIHTIETLIIDVLLLLYIFSMIPSSSFLIMVSLFVVFVAKKDSFVKHLTVIE